MDHDFIFLHLAVNYLQSMYMLKVQLLVEAAAHNFFIMSLCCVSPWWPACSYVVREDIVWGLECPEDKKLP